MDYINGHPFGLVGPTGPLLFVIPDGTGQAEEIHLASMEPLRKRLGLRTGAVRADKPFSVTLDGIALRRPIRLQCDLVKASRVGAPVMIAAKQENPFSSENLERAGGRLSFEAYLYWNSQIVPKETAGVLVRIPEASGTLFDPTFLNYRISEQTRLRQITAEIFVHEGLDSAINIDRESFNYSHPHFLYIQRWLHRALRLLNNRLKALAAADLARTKEELRGQALEYAAEVWKRRLGDDVDPPFADASVRSLPEEIGGVNIEWPSERILTGKSKTAGTGRISALAAILEAYGVLSSLPVEDRARLIRDLLGIPRNRRMTAPSDESDRLIADDVLPTQIDDLAVPIELNTRFPWHRPRKQFVRQHQWLDLSRCLIDSEKGEPGLPQPRSGNPEVRYLTLPGIDYLDVRQLADVCREVGCRLTATGFQSGGEGNRHVARAQLREKSLIDAGHISDYSHTFTGRFEEITEVGSPTYTDLRSRGPFHIVNLDACGSIAPPQAAHPRRLIDAVYRTVELQLEIMTGRWLLFVTADARPDSIARETLEKLCNAIFANAEESEDFRIRAAPLLDPQEADIRAAADRASKKAGEGFLRLFSLGLAKWLLALAHKRSWEMKTHLPYCYSTMPHGDETPSMACLAFEFLPPRSLLDPFEVTRAQPAPTTVREDTSLLAADRIGLLENADSLMRSDKSLHSHMVQELRHLLKEAGYSATVLEEIGT